MLFRVLCVYLRKGSCSMIKWIDKKLFPVPSPVEYMEQTLATASIEMLKAQDALDHARAVVEYRRNQIERLTKQIANSDVLSTTN
jgi:hypothetical protein